MGEKIKERYAQTYYRSASFERGAAKKEDRTVPLSFSSEEAIERFFGMETLDHDPKSVRMERARRGLPLLVNHERGEQVGIVEAISFGKDLKGRGLARFGRSVQAEEIFDDVLGGIRKDVSVGYRIHEMILEKQEEEMAFYRATDWEPMEISLVAVPADINVGVGRSQNSEKQVLPKIKGGRKMFCDKCNSALQDGTCPACNATEREKIRVSDIMSMGQKMGLLDKAIEYVREGKPFSEFSTYVIADARAKLDRTDIRVGSNLAEGGIFRNFAEYLHCVTYKPQDARLAPLSAQRQLGERAMSMGVGTAGGFAVPDQFRPELLQVSSEESLIRLKSYILPTGFPPDSPIFIPCLDQGITHGMHGGFSGQWISEGGPKPETDLFLRSICLEPHEYAATLVSSDKLLRNWESAASIIETSARASLASACEMAYISGSGVGQPLGFTSVLNTSAINVVRTGANAVVFADVNNMLLRILRGGKGSPIWICSSTCLQQLVTIVDIGNHQIFALNVVDPVPMRLYGLPLFIYDRMPPLGTRGDLCLVNLQYYLIKDGSGPFFGSSDQVYYTSNRTVFKIFFNVDGQPWLTEPFPLEGGTAANTVSPFVILN